MRRTAATRRWRNQQRIDCSSGNVTGFSGVGPRKESNTVAPGVVIRQAVDNTESSTNQTGRFESNISGSVALNRRQGLV